MSLSERPGDPVVPRALRRLAAAGLGLSSLALLPACRQDMYDQPRYEPLEASRLFADGKSARDLPQGTVPRDDPRLDPVLWSGVSPQGGFASTPPMPVTRELLERGRERYEIYCVPCHGFAGRGNGMIVQRGYRPPPSFHIDRLREQPLGYFVDVITHGYGVMPVYADQVTPGDRWAIAAYVRALQISQSVRLADLPPEDAARVEGGTR